INLHAALHMRRVGRLVCAFGGKGARLCARGRGLRRVLPSEARGVRLHPAAAPAAARAKTIDEGGPSSIVRSERATARRVLLSGGLPADSLFEVEHGRVGFERKDLG